MVNLSGHLDLAPARCLVDIRREDRRVSDTDVPILGMSV